ncbi:MAG: RagB/SusD family nutrient uptake outer membrane protein, partial [Bacteroidota bacterium]
KRLLRIGDGVDTGQDYVGPLNPFEEIAANDGGRFGQLDDFSTNAGNDLVGDVWRESYEGIQRANVVLARIDAIAYAEESLKSQRIGEVAFIRALLYFNLVRLYGDVPLVLEETQNPSDFFGQGRTAAGAVYDQIEADLNDAIQRLPQTTDEGRPARGAAQALLADVLMNRGAYAEAVPLLQAVVNSGVYQLAPSTDALFGEANEGNAEVLFAVQFASEVNGNAEGNPIAAQFRPSGTTANAKGHNLPSAAFVSLYTDGDTRRNDYVGLDAAANPFYFSTKYEVAPSGVNDSGTDVYVIRYADVLLKLAEALNETGNAGEAIPLLNQVRNRAGLADTEASDQGGVRAAIELERRLEFIGEGHRWFDLKRTGKAVATMNAWFAANNIGVTIDEDNLFLPVPQSQVDTDPTITQNTGY